MTDEYFNVKDVVSWLAVISSFSVYAAGSKTCFTIIRKKTTGDITLFPFIASLFCGVAWLKYAMMTGLSNLVVAASANTICQITYIIIYYTYVRDRRSCTKVILVSIFFIYSLLFYVKYLAKTDTEAIAKLGLVGSGTTILMCASPLISLIDVIKQKSTSSLDFGFILTICISSLLWTYFGFLIKDLNVIIPNGIGLIFAIVQLSLFVIYPTSSPPTKTTDRSTGRSEGL